MKSQLIKRAILSSALILLTAVSAAQFQKEIITTNELGVQEGFPIDMDGDSDMDMIFYSSLNQSVILLENDGSNNFTESAIISDLKIKEFRAAALNSDSKMDIITHNEDELLYYLSGPAGYERKSLGKIGGLTSTYDYRPHFWTADLYGNGREDLVVTTKVYLILFENRGDGTFSAKDTLARQDNSRICRFSDFNSDGRMDIVSLGFDREARLTVYLQNSDQTFTDFDLDTLDNRDDRPILQLADIDGDSRDDIVSLGDYNHVKWYRSGGDGTFTPMPYLSSYGEKNKYFLADDIDRDGDDDYLVVDSLSTVILYKNDGTGKFTETVQECDEAGIYKPVLIDYDKTGSLDLFTLQGGPVVLTGMESGVLKSNTFVDNGCYGAWDAAAADMWGDSHKEILAVGRKSEKLICFTGKNGSYSKELLGTHIKDAQRVVAADINGDNLTDILTGGDTLSIFTQNENRQFELSTTLAGEVHAIAVTDIDSDNDPDIIAHSGSWVNPTRLNIHYNNGDGTTFTSDLYKDIEAYVAEPADIDGDGDMDIITADDVKSFIFLNRQEEDGSFFPLKITDKEYSVKDLHIADMNGDNRPDVLFTASSYAFVLIQDEMGEFSLDTLFYIMNCIALAPGDFNNDGEMDFAALSSSRSKLSLYENSGELTFTETVIDSSKNINYGKSVISTDIDNDGHLDLLVASNMYGTVALYKNLNKTAIESGSVSSGKSAGVEVTGIQSEKISLSLTAGKRNSLIFTLHDIRGRQIERVETVRSENLTINFASPVAAGLYIVSLTGENLSYSRPVIIQ